MNCDHRFIQGEYKMSDDGSSYIFSHLVCHECRDRVVAEGELTKLQFAPKLEIVGAPTSFRFLPLLPDEDDGDYD